ncbi:MAG TPA: efflux RND transporter periplasmic adaptor subunit [Polyangiaceae bacterium]|nr:efflux RND transporter periplasmic adaptor subunit [Polyangiaceae bacterium]
MSDGHFSSSSFGTLGALRDDAPPPPGPSASPARTEERRRPGARAKKRGTFRFLLGATVVLALLIAVGVATRGALKRRATPIHFQTAPIDRGDIFARVSASGVVSALVTVSVGSQVSGRIESLYADFGSQVRKDQIVARIEPSLFKAAVAQARANRVAASAALSKAYAQVVNADRQYVRAKALVSEGLATSADLDTREADLGVARADVDSAQAAVLQAKAAVEQAELNLRYTTIVSPIDGIVISRNVDVGQTVAATLQAPTLFTIAQDLTRMQVDTNVAEADVGRVQPGMNVSFRVDAYPNRVFEGTVRQVRDDAQTIQNVVTYDAVIDVDNSGRLLKPGMTANVTIVYSHRQNVLRMPNVALRFRPDHGVLSAMQGATARAPQNTDERLVWILRDGQAVPLVVRIGVSDGDYTEIVEGRVRVSELAVTEAAVDETNRGDAK